MNFPPPFKLMQNKDVLEFFVTLEEHAGEEMLAENTSNSYIIWAKDNSFPLDVINAGNPSTHKWEGNHEVIEALKKLINDGYTMEFVCREEGDETDFHAAHNQDYKLVITQS
jgi:hypothetical protein